MYEVYCIQTEAIIWRTVSPREAQEIWQEQNDYHKNDNLKFGIR